MILGIYLVMQTLLSEHQNLTWRFICPISWTELCEYQKRHWNMVMVNFGASTFVLYMELCQTWSNTCILFGKFRDLNTKGQCLNTILEAKILKIYFPTLKTVLHTSSNQIKTIIIYFVMLSPTPFSNTLFLDQWGKSRALTFDMCACL